MGKRRPSSAINPDVDARPTPKITRTAGIQVPASLQPRRRGLRQGRQVAHIEIVGIECYRAARLPIWKNFETAFTMQRTGDNLRADERNHQPDLVADWACRRETA